MRNMHAPCSQAVMQNTIVTSKDNRKVNPSFGEERRIMVVNNKPYTDTTFVLLAKQTP